ncbi:hypothetical protein BJ165DRAFT_1056190 [Panaeolus papilionaceus]|nr:hypothetical protein BJ165DRAFT_1056190 [Panaeolus papilionaceus]
MIFPQLGLVFSVLNVSFLGVCLSTLEHKLIAATEVESCSRCMGFHIEICFTTSKCSLTDYACQVSYSGFIVSGIHFYLHIGLSVPQLVVLHAINDTSSRTYWLRFL